MTPVFSALFYAFTAPSGKVGLNLPRTAPPVASVGLAPVSSYLFDLAPAATYDWENIDQVVAAMNTREDMFGVVGGTYMLIDGALLSAVVLAYFLSTELKKR